MIATAAQLKRTQRDYSEIGGEPVEIEQVGSALYIFGSELATLRLFRKMPKCGQGYSENLKKFYFCVELAN
jgi:hypothetical protein